MSNFKQNMKTEFNLKEFEVIVQIIQIITEMRKCELEYDKEIILDICLNGEVVLDFYFENESGSISQDLIEMITVLSINLGTEYKNYEEKEIFMTDIIYKYLDRFINVEKLSSIRNFYQENKTGKYANLIIDILKEAQFVDENLNHVYVNHNILEMIMISGVNSFYDHFGVRKKDMRKEFILACEAFNNQFKKDYPTMTQFDGACFNYYASKGIGSRSFIRNVIYNITKYLEIDVKHQPVFIDLKQVDSSIKNTIYLRVYIGKRKSGRIIFQHQYDLNKKLKKSEISQIIVEVEKTVNITKPNSDLENLLGELEYKLGVAA